MKNEDESVVLLLRNKRGKINRWENKLKVM